MFDDDDYYDDGYDDDGYDDGEPDFGCWDCEDSGTYPDGRNCRFCRPTPRQRRRAPLRDLWLARHHQAIHRRREKDVARGRAAWDERPF